MKQLFEIGDSYLSGAGDLQIMEDVMVRPSLHCSHRFSLFLSKNHNVSKEKGHMSKNSPHIKLLIEEMGNNVEIGGDYKCRKVGMINGKTQGDGRHGMSRRHGGMSWGAYEHGMGIRAYSEHA